MIHVDRFRLDRPQALATTALASLYDELRRQISEPLAKRKRRSLLFEPISPEVRGAVRELFWSKCAYCEQIIAKTQRGDVDHFRPTSNAVGLKGDVAPDHYWWLAYEWDNMYMSCETCNRKYKRSRFPVKGPRAEPEMGGEDLFAEEALLLDPCDRRADRDPEGHLVYEPDGSVYSTTEEGRTTIDTFGLNREELRVRRELHYASVGAMVEPRTFQYSERSLAAQEARDVGGAEAYYRADMERRLKPIRSAIAPQAEFAGLARQIVQRTLGVLPAQKAKAVESSITGLEEDLKATRHVTKAGAREVKTAYKKAKEKQEQYSLDQDDAAGYYAGTKYVERVVIENFRGIKRLDIDLTRGQSDDPYLQALTMERPYPPADEATEPRPDAEIVSAPWTMLLGENATGKSSILQAIALALVGEDYRRDLPDTNASNYVRRPRCRRGKVDVHLSEMSQPQRIEFHLDRRSFEGRDEAKVLLLGYGATRLLPRPNHPETKGRRYGRVENLFDPFVPVIDADRFLFETHQADPNRSRFVLDALERLLGFDEHERIFPEGDEMLVHLAGSTVPLAWLSDGYQSLLALACDIMAKLLDRWDSMSIAEGVVLIDEIGAHMHPRWRMRIVRRLREAFPRVQFIATTHDPLCLRWLLEGEVVVMRRSHKNEIVAIQDALPPIGGMPVDQLLTSEHFGLSATVDPEVEDLFDEYYVLLGMKQRTTEQERRLGQLKAALYKLDQLGTTRRERLMLEAIDRYLAKESEHLEDQSAFMAKLERELDGILAATEPG